MPTIEDMKTIPKDHPHYTLVELLRGIQGITDSLSRVLIELSSLDKNVAEMEARRQAVKVKP